MQVKRKEVMDLIVYLQKKYKLYFVEFRKALNGKNVLVLCNPYNKNWWVCIGFYKRPIATVIIGNAGKEDIHKKEIKEAIENKEYLGYAENYKGRWLKL